MRGLIFWIKALSSVILLLLLAITIMYWQTSDSTNITTASPANTDLQTKANEISFDGHTPNGKKFHITAQSTQLDDASDVLHIQKVCTQLSQDCDSIINLNGDFAILDKHRNTLTLRKNIHFSDNQDLKVESCFGVLDFNTEQITGNKGIVINEHNCCLTGDEYVISKAQECIEITGKAQLKFKN